MGNWCIARWGYRADLSIDEDDEDADADEVINIEDSTLPEDDDLSEEEADLRTQYYNTLRTVRLVRDVFLKNVVDLYFLI